MAVIQIKKYKYAIDENGNKIKVEKPKEIYNRETRNGTCTWFYKVYYKDARGNRKQKKSKVYRTKQEAKESERLFLMKRERPLHKEFLLVAEDYFNDYKTKRKDNSYDTYLNAYNSHIKPFFSKYYIDKIDVDTIKLWQEEMLEKTYIKKGEKHKYSINFLNKCHIILSNIFRFAVISYGIEKNPVQLLGAFEGKNDEVITDEERLRYITLDDFNAFISVIDSLMWKTFFIFLMYSGMRKGEVFALKWRDIDFENNEIKVDKTMDNKKRITNTKNRKNRKVKMNAFLRNQLLVYKCEMIKYRDFDEDWFVFGGIEPLSRATVDRQKDFYFDLVNKDRKDIIPSITIHEFRHSHVSMLINEYVKKCERLNLKVDATKFFIMMADRMGHTVQTMLKVYMHLFPTVQDEIVELLDNIA